MEISLILIFRGLTALEVSLCQQNGDGFYGISKIDNKSQYCTITIQNRFAKSKYELLPKKQKEESQDEYHCHPHNYTHIILGNHYLD